MIIKIKYFGMIAEHIGVFEEEINLPEKTTDLRATLEQRYPKLGNLTYKIAVNQELTSSLEGAGDAAEVALLPPFAGG